MITGRTVRDIVESVEEAVAGGALAAGTKLASVRLLAWELGVSPTTVAAAYAELRRRGVVVSRARSGVAVAERPPAGGPRLNVAVPDGIRDLANGNPDPKLLPDIGPVLRKLAGSPPRLYGDAAVDPELGAVASAALRRDGIDPENLCIVNGSLDGVERVLFAHLAPGDRVAIEDPGFAGLIDLVRSIGVIPVPVVVDALGVVPGALNTALKEGVSAVVLTPRGHNPTGASFDAGRARDVRRVLARFESVLVVEDDHLGPVAGTPVFSICAGRSCWAVVRSASKWLAPDLRLAVLAGDERTIRRVAGRQAVGPGWVSTLIQRIAASLWGDPEVMGLADQAATVYGGRRRALVDALAEQGIEVEARSGLNLWIPVPDEDAATRALLVAGFAVSAGARHRLASGPAVRVTTATMRPAEAPVVAAALAAAVKPERDRTRAA